MTKAPDDSGKAWLSHLTKVLAISSVVVISTALATNDWLITEELINSAFLQNDAAFAQNQNYVKKTYSGLFTVCISNFSTDLYDCFQIHEAFDDSYISDPGDSAWAVPYAATKSLWFFLTSTVLLCFAELFFISSLLGSRDWCIFVSGVTFIVAGLLMLVGVISLVSLFRAEVGNKLRPPSSNKAAQMTFTYGYSFLLYMSGLALIEATGTCAIFLYLKTFAYSLAQAAG